MIMIMIMHLQFRLIANAVLVEIICRPSGQRDKTDKENLHLTFDIIRAMEWKFKPLLNSQR